MTPALKNLARCAALALAVISLSLFASHASAQSLPGYQPPDKGKPANELSNSQKAAQGKAPVYKYYFQWYSPVREGKLRSMHTMDIAFAFDNVDIARTEIGGGPERQPLADRMARAWVAFARTGNPSHLGLPAWPAYAFPQRATMVFNNECRVVNNPYGEEKAALGAVAASRATTA